jgi:hypothetical protein
MHRGVLVLTLLDAAASGGVALLRHYCTSPVHFSARISEPDQWWLREVARMPCLTNTLPRVCLATDRTDCYAPSRANHLASDEFLQRRCIYTMKVFHQFYNLPSQLILIVDYFAVSKSRALPMLSPYVGCICLWCACVPTRLRLSRR